MSKVLNNEAMEQVLFSFFFFGGGGCKDINGAFPSN